MIPHFILAVIAQSGLEANPVTLLTVYGPMGVIIAWFMFRFEKWMARLNHKIDGLTRAMLITELGRETANPHSHARELAKEMLAKIKLRDDREKD